MPRAHPGPPLPSEPLESEGSQWVEVPYPSCWERRLGGCIWQPQAGQGAPEPDPQTAFGGAGKGSCILKAFDSNIYQCTILSCFMKKMIINEINSVSKIWEGWAARGKGLFKHTSKSTVL